MLNSIAVYKNRELRFPKKTLYGALAVLALAAQCAAAPGMPMVSITTSSTGPGGFIFDGTRVWVTDANRGFCRMDPGGGGAGFQLTSCILPSTSKLGVQAVLGQPAYDPATNFVYLPDMSTASKGIWRYAFNGQDFNSGGGINIAPAAGLGALRPGAIALGPDGNLYVTMAGNSSYVRVNTPAAAAQIVDKMSVTLSGLPARGVAFVGTQLWIADRDGELMVPGAAACGGKAAACKGTLNTQVGVPNPLSITWDAANSYVYIGTGFGVFRHNRLDGQTVLYSKYWENCNGKPGPCAAPSASGFLTNVIAVGLDGAGNLYYADDPTASQIVGGASVYSVPFGSAADGQGTLGSPAPTVPPALSAAPPSANPALLYSTGLTTPRGALYIGTHVWVVDSALGFCKVDPTLPAPSLTACAVLPLGFVPGSPAYDKGTSQIYIGDLTVAGAGIVRLPFNTASETVGAATTVVTNKVLTAAATGATAPTALAFGPDKQLYAAVAGTPAILRVTNPAGSNHLVTFVGSMFEAGSVSIAFHNSDLWNVETQDSSVLYNATLCNGTCTSLFFSVVLLKPTAVASDGNFVYIGDGQKVMKLDTVANIYAALADTGMVNGVATAFSGVTGIASDGLGHVFAADATHLWEIAASAAPIVTSLAPFQAPEGSTKTITITGDNFLPGVVVSTCGAAITPGNVTVVSLSQITATFAINPVGPLGPCNITVTTPNGASAASAGSTFTVLIGPPALTTITPTSGYRGRTTAVSIAGANMTNGAIDLIPGITITGSSVTDTLITANFVIDPAAALGPTNVTVTTPSGTSNALSILIQAPPPVLTSIAPTSGVANSTVAMTLTGSDLVGAAVDPLVGVFTVSGAVVTATSIQANLAFASGVPAGPLSITVTGPGGTSSPKTFTILPALTGINPTSARAGTPTTVTLTGTSLAGVTTVNAGPNITVTGVTATASTVTASFASALDAPLGPQTVTATDVNGTTSAATFTLTAPVPVVSGIAPTTGGTGATVAITLTGTGLVGGTLNLPAGAGISLVGTPVVSFSQITANLKIAGNAPLGAANITVTTPGGTSAPATFTVFALAPLINTITPATTAAGSTVTVTLAGRGFTGVTSVDGSAECGASSFTVVSDSQITATLVTTLNATTLGITVTNPNGTSNPVTFGIVPTLTGISPAFKPAGTSVSMILTGTSLTGATAIGTGTAGISVSGINVDSSTQITATFTIAAGAVQGNHSITVITPGGTTNPVAFNVLPPPPTISSINSPFSRGAGNQGVTLAGANFNNADITTVKVFLNGTQVPLVVSNTAVAGSIIVSPGSFQNQTNQLRWNQTIPASMPVSSGTQVYTITVTTPSGTTAPFGFTVQ